MTESTTKALCAFILVLGLVGPLVVGMFVMPSDSYESAKLEVGPTLDITTGLEDSTANQFVTNVSYLNNLYLLNMNGLNAMGSQNSTTVANNFPGNQYTGVTNPSVSAGTVDLTSYITSTASYQNYVFDFPDSLTITDSDGERVRSVSYYPTTQLAYATLYDGTAVTGSEQVDPKTGLTSSGSGTFTLWSYVQKTDASGKALYNDPSEGLRVWGGDSTAYYIWTNTVKNTVVAFVICPDSEDTISFRIPSNGVTYTVTNSPTLTISNSLGESKTLGDYDAYPYQLLVFNTEESTVTYSGLVGMSSYTNWPVGKAGNSVVLTDQDLGSTLNAVQMWGNGSYYVPYTMSNSGPRVTIMEDKTFSPYHYVGTYYWQVGFGVSTYTGDNILVHMGTATGDLHYSGGKLHVPSIVYDENWEDFTYTMVEVPLLNCILSVKPVIDSAGVSHGWSLFVNDHMINELVTDVTVGEFTVEMQGTWKVPVWVASISETDGTTYVWEPGTFNIDTTTFMGLGAVFSFVGLLVSMTYGRISDAPVLIPTMFGLCMTGFYIGMLIGVV